MDDQLRYVPVCLKKSVLRSGSSKLFLGFWVVLHVVGLSLSVVNYQMKHNLDKARSTFGWTFGKLYRPSWSIS
jgi:hypothetical protein